MSDDYASFGYLDDQPAAFARFPLAPESGRVPGYDGGFDPATIERAEALLTRKVLGGNALRALAEIWPA
jgi:hypothetical protein